MKRIRSNSLAWSSILLVVFAGAAFARPVVNGATIETRTFNDCPISTVTTSNNYPASIEITDAMNPLCVGFANLHSWSFSEDGGATAAVFNNNSNFHFGADLVIEGAGEGEGGLRISPWYGKFVDGRFMINVTSGEIACFGGAIPFYSFTVNHGISYTRGTPIHMEITYQAHDLTSAKPATIQYHLVYNNTTYDSPVLPFGEQNPNECNAPQHNGQWGMLNDGRVGSYFQPRANSAASLTARWTNIFYEQIPPDGTPSPDAAFIALRTFNDCPISTVSSTNSYPASIQITDAMDPLCVGFANLHSWSFSDDGGATAARFDNNSSYQFGADLKIEGAGEGEGGLRISPWYGQLVDGRFMANATTGEIACFGGAIPFYSFTVNHGISYTRGTTIRFEVAYDGHENISTNPGTIQYRVIYNGNTYDSPVLPFGQQNPNECNFPQYNGLWGMLNDGRVGAYFQPRANTGASLTATWSNISFAVINSKNQNPDCSLAVASETTLWPPNHKYHAISILGVTDPDGDPVTITVTGVTQDEPVNTRGDGNTCPDAQISGSQASVRAERTGTPSIPGNGRVYRISFVADDGQGGQCQGSVSVCVPHDQGAHSTCIDDGQRFDSLGPCTGGGLAMETESVVNYGLSVGAISDASVELEFSLAAPGRVLVTVFDVAGRRMATIENADLSSGVYHRTWNVVGVSKGLYFVRMQVGGVSLTKAVLKTAS